MPKEVAAMIVMRRIHLSANAGSAVLPWGAQDGERSEEPPRMRRIRSAMESLIERSSPSPHHAVFSAVAQKDAKHIDLE